MSENNEIKAPLNKNFREPKLRFRSFENQWNKSTFGDVVNLSKKKYNPLKSNESLIDLEMDSVESKTGRLLVKYNSLSFDSIKNSFTENDVLYGKLRPYLRKYYMPKFNGVCSSEFWVLNSTYLVQNFLYYYISSDSFNFETNKTCGTKMPRAEWSQIIKLEFYYPEIDEQRIIGTFLQLFDRKIDILSNKIETLKKYKEGLIKKLINSSNKEMKLSQLITVCEKTKLQSSYGKTSGKYKFFINSSDEITKWSDDYIFDGEYLILNTGGTAFTNYVNGKFSAMSDCLVVKTNSKYSITIYYWFKSVEKWIDAVGFQGTGLKHLDINWLLRQKVKIIEYDNKKLSNFNKELNSLIELNSLVLEKLKLLKNIFLNLMFI